MTDTTVTDAMIGPLLAWLESHGRSVELATDRNHLGVKTGLWFCSWVAGSGRVFHETGTTPALAIEAVLWKSSNTQRAFLETTKGATA
jgi:hypothetical protein